MTREEAIFCEKSYIGETNCVDCKYYGTDTCLSRESHRMAIQALEQEPIIDKIRAEIEQLRLHKAEFLTNDNRVCIDSQEVLNVIDKYKAESDSQESIEKESIPYLMHKEMGIPISECQKAYDVAIEYLRGRAKVKG